MKYRNVIPYQQGAKSPQDYSASSTKKPPHLYLKRKRHQH
jgi:hypothetical protein